MYETTALPEPTDDELIHQARAGAPLALVELIRRHEAGLRAALHAVLRNAHDVDDCLQETWLRVSATLVRFREGSAFAPWVRTIGTNVALSLRRRRRPTSLDARDLPVADVEAPDEPLQREQAERVRRAIQDLPTRYRRVVELRLVRELDHAEIARLLDLTLGAVRVLFCRGLRRVRKALNEAR